MICVSQETENYRLFYSTTSENERNEELFTEGSGLVRSALRAEQAVKQHYFQENQLEEVYYNNGKWRTLRG